MSKEKMSEKLDMSSPDMASKNIEQIAALFPNCVTETAEGKAIDFDLLKQELSADLVEGTKERYRLEWPGKKEAIVTANLPTTKTLRPVREDSVDFNSTENLFIEGDNLEVLKLLQESYLGKVKMIYIDPPYNTGKEFVYQDNFTQDSTQFKEQSGLIDIQNKKLIQNPETSGRYHSDWLSMMYPRLKLARNLLKDDGVIFISIDDNEVHNLRKLCDEIFGETNFISQIIWEKRYGRSNDQKFFSSVIDYILLYRKSDSLLTLKEPRKEENNKIYNNPDDDPRGPWTSVSFVSQRTKEERPNLSYSITNPNTGKSFQHPVNAWKYSEEKFKELLNDNRFYWGKDGKQEQPRIKRFLSELPKGLVPVNLWKFQEAGTGEMGTKEVDSLLGKEIFTYPKPTKLLKKIIEIGSNDNDIVLDFFAGSGSLGHAVLDINTETVEKRKFILVQIPEETKDKTEAFKAGYKSIAEISRERIRRAAQKIKEETSADIDYGFRVYRLDESNMQDVYYHPQDYQQENMELFADNIKEGRTADDLLAQVMLDWGLPLSLGIESLDISGKQVFKVAENSLMACFDTGIDEAFAKEIAKHNPIRVVFRDSSFKDDTAKENVKQLLKQLSPDTEMRVI